MIGEGSRLGRRARARLLDDALARVDSLDGRLAAIERWVGMRPHLDDLDEEIGHVRREKEAAVGQQDFEAAAVLRDKEKQLLAARAAREKEWTEAAPAARRSPGNSAGSDAEKSGRGPFCASTASDRVTAMHRRPRDWTFAIGA